MFDLIVSGLILGFLISTGAIGVTLVARILDFFNAAHGTLFALGAYLSLMFVRLLPDMGTFPTFSFGPSMIIALILSTVVTSAIAVISDRIYYKPLRNKGVASMFLTLSSLGLMFILRSSIYLGWGSKVRYYSWDVPYNLNLPFGGKILADELFIIVFATLVLASVQIFLRRTAMGKALRAMADNEDLARSSGVNTDKMVTLTWALAGGLCAIGGTLYGIAVQIKPLMGWDFLLTFFVAVIVGGVGSIRGAVTGAFIIGFVQEIGAGLLQNLMTSIGLDAQMYSYKLAIAFSVMILVLLVRPEGLRGLFWEGGKA